MGMPPDSGPVIVGEGESSVTVGGVYAKALPVREVAAFAVGLAGAMNKKTRYSLMAVMKQVGDVSDTMDEAADVPSDSKVSGGAAGGKRAKMGGSPTHPLGGRCFWRVIL